MQYERNESLTTKFIIRQGKNGLIGEATFGNYTLCIPLDNNDLRQLQGTLSNLTGEMPKDEKIAKLRHFANVTVERELRDLNGTIQNAHEEIAVLSEWLDFAVRIIDELSSQYDTVDVLSDYTDEMKQLREIITAYQ